MLIWLLFPQWTPKCGCNISAIVKWHNRHHTAQFSDGFKIKCSSDSTARLSMSHWNHCVGTTIKQCRECSSNFQMFSYSNLENNWIPKTFRSHNTSDVYIRIMSCFTWEFLCLSFFHTKVRSGIFWFITCLVHEVIVSTRSNYSSFDPCHFRCHWHRFDCISCH